MTMKPPPPHRREWPLHLFQVLLVLIGLLILAERGCNFEFGYKSQVEETVRAMVRPECLLKEAP